jgi:peptidyl-prolyl cis-trans isomerase SurA
MARRGIRRSREEAKEEAERILAEARRDPALFGQLAAARSDDATRKQGGDLGSFRHGAMPQALEEAMAHLKIGEVGGPVLTPYGYHVLLRREAPTDKDYVVH